MPPGEDAAVLAGLIETLVDDARLRVALGKYGLIPEYTNTSIHLCMYICLYVRTYVRRHILP